jgi:hypothetical protein
MILQELISVIVVSSFGAAYILRILLFDLHAPGPFESISAFVTGDTGTTRSINLFDRFRRLFGAYRVTERSGLRLWAVWEPRMQVWYCPKCLSFYSSLPFSVFTVIWAVGASSLRDGLMWAVPIHLAIVFLAQLLVFIQMYVEGDDDGVQDM